MKANSAAYNKKTYKITSEDIDARTEHSIKQGIF